MKIIGITGNFGGGKSFIAGLFRKYYCEVIGLDQLGHIILEKPKIKKQLIAQFGKYILQGERVSREKLRKIVFSRKEYLDKLNRIIHPEMIRSLKEKIKRGKEKNYRAIIIDAALIYEMGIVGLMDIIIVISTWKLISYLRVLKKRKIVYREFDNIYNSQIPLKVKEKKADYIIYNNLPFKYTYKKIKKIIKKILG